MKPWNLALRVSNFSRRANFVFCVFRLFGMQSLFSGFLRFSLIFRPFGVWFRLFVLGYLTPTFSQLCSHPPVPGNLEI